MRTFKRSQASPTYWSTVREDRPSVAAISTEVFPAAARRKHSIWRGLRLGAASLGIGAPTGLKAHKNRFLKAFFCFAIDVAAFGLNQPEAVPLRRLACSLTLARRRAKGRQRLPARNVVSPSRAVAAGSSYRDLVLIGRAAHIPLAGGPSLTRASFLVALLAVIMLVIGGAPARASAGQCNPCPPDCPMMKAQAAADQHQKAPSGNPAETPCKAMVVCPTAIAMPVLPEALALTALSPRAVRQRLVNERLAPSRPPDRELRPPISL